MNINRNNYEEFFILYLDNELNSEERRQLEFFVQSHPDLKEELDLLQQFKLVPDASLVFPRKESLLKNTPPVIKEKDDRYINSTNYPEWFNLYIDNELSETEKAGVQQFISENPAYEKELLLLNRVKLVPEEIIFENKASLYKTKEKIFVLPVRWWRVAAAAILILGIGLVTYNLSIRKTLPAGTGIAKTPVSKEDVSKENSGLTTQKSSPGNTLAAEDSRKIREASTDQKSLIKNNQQLIPAITAADTKKINDNRNNTVKQPVIHQKELLIADNQPKTNNLPSPENNPSLQLPGVNQSIALNQVSKENVNQSIPVENIVTNKTSAPSNIVQASFKDDTIFDQDDKKNKLRGFFRKITRTIEKRTDINATDDDGKLLVAGLAFKLK